jgi:hypothetical protein
MPLLTGSFDDIGDVFILQLSPIAVATAFTGYAETVTGESAPTKVFSRMFRYSSNGGYTFSDWTDLTTGNLTSITADPLALYYFEIRYERQGTDSSGTMEWTFFNLSATVNPSQVTTFFPNQPFRTPNIFGNFHVNAQTYQELCGNLLTKIEGSGIIPEYIERSDDYKHFWETTCCFFALHYLIADRLANIYIDKELLRDYLLQRGVFLCGTETLSELQVISQDYYEKMRLRGTEGVLPEIKRLICSCECCEFIFAQVKNYEAGWVIDNASPNYRSGVQNIEKLNKYPTAEHGESVVAKANYGLLNPSDVIIHSTTDNDGNAIDAFRIKDVTPMTGIGFDKTRYMSVKLDYQPNSQHTDPSWYMNYEISVMMKMLTSSTPVIGMGVDCFDCDGNLIPNATMETNSNTIESWFFRQVDLKQTVKFEHITGIVYSKFMPQADMKTNNNNGLGINLRVNPAVASKVKYIYPKIITEGTGCTIIMYDMKVGLVSLPYELGFIEIANHIAAFFANNNGTISNAEVERRIKRYLIPINSQLNIVNL